MNGPSSCANCTDTVFYTKDELVEHEAVAENMKASLVKKTAISRKCDLLDVSLASDDGDHDAQFIIGNMEVLRKMFASETCITCETVSLHFRSV